MSSSNIKIKKQEEKDKKGGWIIHLPTLKIKKVSCLIRIFNIGPFIYSFLCLEFSSHHPESHALTFLYSSFVPHVSTSQNLLQTPKLKCSNAVFLKFLVTQLHSVRVIISLIYRSLSISIDDCPHFTVHACPQVSYFCLHQSTIFLFHAILDLHLFVKSNYIQYSWKDPWWIIQVQQLTIGKIIIIFPGKLFDYTLKFNSKQSAVD